MDSPRRTGPYVLVLLLLLQSFAAISVSANPTAGAVSTFDGGIAAPTVNLIEGQINTQLGIEVPRNVTFNTASFIINARDEVPSPGQVYIDIGQDGVKEWAFEGQGYGDLGHQNTFANGNTTSEVFSNGSVSSLPFILPFASAIESAQVNTSFAPEVNGGLMPVGAVTDYTSGDVDNDTLPEIVVLSRDSTVTGFNAGVLRIDWDSASGLDVSSWAQTCAGASEVAVGDFNDDGHDDIVTFAYGSDLACVHFTNATTSAIGAAQPLSLYSNSISAAVGDFNNDGYADVVSIHAGGQFVVRTYSDKISAFTDNQTHTVMMNNTATATTLTSMTGGVFGVNSTTFSAVVTDFFGHSTPLGWTLGSGISENPNHFDGIESDLVAGDFNGDGNIDFIGTNQQGYTIALNDGLQWNTTNVLSTVALTNASVFDHDGDGTTSLVVPSPGSSDGSAQTVDGNLTVFALNATLIGNVSAIVQPWSIPTNVQAVDMNGDGFLEHIVAAGESALGLYIGGWHQIGLDVNNDGQDDLVTSGYSGDASFGMMPLYIEDPMGNTSTILSTLMNALPYTADGYGVRLSILDFSLSNTGNGTFNLSGMDIGYDAFFIVENNPFSAGNLTNIINQQQTAGTGTILIPIPVNATRNGTFAVSGLNAQYVPGAPNLSLPPTPVLSVTELTSDRVTFEWQDISDFGDELIQFEVFRSAPNAAFDLTSPLTIEGGNMTIDGDIVHGESYVYGVRSLHSFGVTSSMSTPLLVTIPYPAPPSAVNGLTLSDTTDDTGGSLDVTWNISGDGPVEYRVYVESSNIISLDGLVAIATLPHSTNQPTMSVNTAELGSILVDGTPYYAAVVAFDNYGNATSSFSTAGPVSPLNNSMRSALIEYTLSSSSDHTLNQFGLSALDSLYLNITLSANGEFLAGEALELHAEASGITFSISGTTDSEGVWQAVAAEDLTELGGTFTTFFDSASFTIEYLGNSGGISMQPVAPATLTLEGIGLLRAEISMDGSVLSVDESGVYNLEVDLSAELPTQNTYLEGLTYSWEQHNASGNVTSSGTIEVKGGQLILSGTANSTDTLTLTSDPSKSWIIPSINPLVFSFTGGPDDSGNDTNETDSNETGNNQTDEPSFPDATLPGTVVCDAGAYTWEDNGADLAFTCTITNPNPFDVFVGFSWKVIPTTPPPFTFESSSLTGSGPTLTISAEGSTQVEFLPVRNGPSDGLFPGIQGVGYVVYITCSELGGANQCDAMSTPSASTEGELQWTLDEPLKTDAPIDTTPTETKSSTPLLVGGILGLLLLLAVAGGVIVLRNKEEEEDDWYVEEEEETADPVVEKPGRESSKSLHELKSEGRSIEDIEVPEERASSLFDEFDTSPVDEIEDYEVETTEDESSLEEADEVAEEADISTDENGTEWWEDEEGVWWYREEGWEDWAVWED